MLRKDVIPARVANADAHRGIRIWSVGCASGEEPYSIAMLLAEEMGISNFRDHVKMYATHLDDEALRTARQATYGPRDVESVPTELLEKYFERTKNHYIFECELRKCVIFGRHNVVHDAPISHIDLLTCRSLLIYLEAETQNVVLPRLPAEAVIGTSFDELDIGLPVQALQEPMAQVQAGREEQIDVALEGVDRRGRHIACRIRGVAAVGRGRRRAGADAGVPERHRRTAAGRLWDEHCRNGVLTPR